MKSPPFSLAYALGRKSAPLFMKAQWIAKSLAGSESEKIEAEFKMGCLLAQVYEEKVPAFANNRLSAIAKKLTDCLQNKARRFCFKCDHSGLLNALAFPGGFIYLSEVLFDHCGEDRDAIAFVLAHEIAHTIHRDANRRFLTKAAITGLSHTRMYGTNPAIQSILSHLVQQGYSHEQEFRADRFAVALTQAAGFDPAGGCRLFASLESGESANHYFSSHPAFADRIMRIQQRMTERAGS